MATTLIAPHNFFGYGSHLLLDKFLPGEVHAKFLAKINYGELEQHISEDTTVLIIVGLPFYSSQTDSFTELLDKLSLRGLPFTEVIHIAAWGDKPEIDGVVSFYQENKCLTDIVADFLTKGAELVKPVELNVGGKKLVQYLSEYHSYSFLHYPTSAPLSLKLLADTYRDNFYTAVELTDNGVEFDSTLRDSLYTSMESYITRKLDTVEIRLINDCVFIMLYAEQFHNEIAHRLIKAYTEAGYSDVVVFIGKQTKGDDMFHVRVSTNLNAGEIAKRLNSGKGNEHAATVFLGKTRQALMNSLESELSNVL